MISRPVIYRPIGIIHSEHTEAEKTPIQPVYARGCKGQVKIFEEFSAGLGDLEGFSHIYLLYHFHQASPTQLLVKPFLQDAERGVFATRAPCRPNTIGLSVVKLVKREGNILHVEDVDILDGTPLLDIKPYTSKFDLHDVKKSGWQDEVDDVAARERGKRNYDK
jgi:tRNA-Thr(GGU) m(6)t(6)A37 methyltransferase TsaA